MLDTVYTCLYIPDMNANSTKKPKLYSVGDCTACGATVAVPKRKSIPDCPLCGTPTTLSNSTAADLNKKSELLWCPVCKLLSEPWQCFNGACPSAEGHTCIRYNEGEIK